MELQEIFRIVVALFGSIVTQIFGGFDPLFIVFMIAVIIDYITGLIASGIEGKLSSQIGFKGIGKKIMIFSLVAVAHILDQLIESNHLIRDATIFFYLANEILSIIENAGRAGVPVPQFLRKAVKIFRNKSK